jgi:phosphatidylserine decarboxylase
VVEQGDQFGFIKFGSRVDLFLPVGTQIMVNIGEVVKGGRTVLAKLADPAKTAVKIENTAPLSKTHAEPTLVIEYDVVMAVKKPAAKAAPKVKPDTKK